MVITVYKNRKIKKEYEGNEGSQNENKVSELEFIIPEEYSSFDKDIVFITIDGNFSKEIVNDSYVLENDITQYGKMKAYVWCHNSETEEDFRSEMFDINLFKNENSTEQIPEETQIN